MRTWIARVAFGIVFCWNVLCALHFIIDPASYMAAYQIEGAGATAAIRGFGVAFLMWNATYPLFIWRPQRFRALGCIIIAQQIIGLVGELGIYLLLPLETTVLQQSIMRFVAFDATGLALMVIAFAFALRHAAVTTQ